MIERLTRSESTSIVSIVAPAGYGKTTLLTTWAARDDRPFAWISIDEYDNDPRRLLEYVARSLGAVEPMPQRVSEALDSPASSVPDTVVPRLSAAFASMTTPVVLVLDDVHLLESRESRLALSVLADHVPAGSQIVFAGRAAPPLRVARLRAEDRLLEIGADDLALSVEEAALLLRGADVVVSAAELDALYARTEGWPVGLYLAALYVRDSGLAGAPGQFSGDDRYVDEYIESEFLSRISRAQRKFLTRAAAFERMSASLCEAALDLPGASTSLAVLANSNLLLVPLDHNGRWYRFHHLFRDLLRAELERREPGMLDTLRRRAADWHLEHGEPEEAIEYSILAGDIDTVARLADTLWTPLYRRGQFATLQRWFTWLDERGGIGTRAMSAVNAALLALTTGHATAAERWSEAVDRWRYSTDGPAFDTYSSAMAALLRAMTCRHGIRRMREDADEAARLFADASELPRAVLQLQGTARALAGDLDAADAYLADAELAEPTRSVADVFANTMCQRALIALSRGDWSAAGAFVERGRSAQLEAGIEESFAAAFVAALRARIHQHRGEVATARRELQTALRLRTLLTYALPHHAVQCRLALIHVHLTLDDVATARTLMQEVDDILRRRPRLGTLVDEAEGLRSHLSALEDAGPGGASTLTTAELRVLPLLATHMSYSEIASELFLSKNTIKSQTYSLFRKLDVSSRSEAVARSRQLALLQG
ncbi:helix-turn-helix transcriptional regulator [Microbacterium sp. ASV49]|uniref:LuxR C-terminal-related transcriptional regulator n=1 Tax=Microbacterium candidum TaxID=3041922 RepID=A0ABT7MYK6_9MICO|nr:LuxR C-terminal-related transcriptional regulator [Microbacterium sp. ASV49]MDL9979534.1 LuxR C-terminal-related transcriptional regulator [Microbacterium sp. ASV49]